MKTFFTQPIGQLGRQNALGFIGLNVVLLVVGFGEIDLPVGLGNFLNFLWGFSLLSIILAGYYLVKDQVPEVLERGISNIRWSNPCWNTY